jgi:hypothetical protein
MATRRSLGVDVWERHAYYLAIKTAAPITQGLVERGELGRGREGY